MCLACDEDTGEVHRAQTDQDEDENNGIEFAFCAESCEETQEILYKVKKAVKLEVLEPLPGIEGAAETAGKKLSDGSK